MAVVQGCLSFIYYDINVERLVEGTDSSGSNLLQFVWTGKSAQVWLPRTFVEMLVSKIVFSRRVNGALNQPFALLFVC